MFRPAVAVWEPTSWLRGRVAERVALAEVAGLRPHYGPAVVVLPLGSSGRPGSIADRSCDRCDVFVPDGTDMQMLVLRAAAFLLLAGGLCETCADREAVIA